jgi:hypothetical protein
MPNFVKQIHLPILELHSHTDSWMDAAKISSAILTEVSYYTVDELVKNV